MHFRPEAVGPSELLHHARLIAMCLIQGTHVVAIHRDDESVDGRVAFRKYDNDSEARRHGT